MQEKPREFIVVFPMRGNSLLFALKTRKIGAGRLNGYGGNIEPGETPEQAAVRELQEESGLETTELSLEKIAIVDFHNQTENGAFTAHVHMFLAHAWAGKVRETEEMIEPKWYPKDALPLDQMMPADRDWLPPALAGKKIRAEAWYSPGQQSLLQETKIWTVQKFD